HIASDQYWWTGIVAYDPSGGISRLTITPYTAEGTRLDPVNIDLNGNRKYVNSVSGIGLPAAAAWMQIDAASGITGFELFGSTDNRTLAGYTGVDLKATKGIFAKLDDSGWTGLALVNCGDTAAKITLRARDRHGRLKAMVSDIPVTPHQRLMGTPERLFPGQDLSDAVYIDYESDQELVGFQINGDGDYLDALPALVY
ncbi:MAG: hypothetical protein GXO34_04450, partial [Deltaproteobacteria bacterium]|nr:hypothetical protein [Deltaproteobacteria bacterium]